MEMVEMTSPLEDSEGLATSATRSAPLPRVAVSLGPTHLTSLANFIVCVLLPTSCNRRNLIVNARIIRMCENIAFYTTDLGPNIILASFYNEHDKLKQPQKIHMSS
jgi:hypothetical protein